MIRRWEIRNVKSYEGEHKIPLSWINVIAGANSSGKSTIIQSILLLKQTLQYGSAEKSLLLNGPLLRLGSFDDVICSYAKEQEIAIGIECSFSQQEINVVNQKWLRASRLIFPSATSSNNLNRVSVHMAWGSEQQSLSDAGKPSLSPSLTKTRVEVARETASGSDYQFIELAPWAQHQSPKSSAPFSCTLDPISDAEIKVDRPNPSILGAFTEYFLPQYSVVSYDLRAKKANEIASRLFSGPFTFLNFSRSSPDDLLPRAVFEYIEDWLTRHDGNIPNRKTSKPTAALYQPLIEEVNRRNINLPGIFKAAPPSDAYSADLAAAREAVADLFRTNAPPEQDFDFSIAKNLRNGSEIVKEFLKNGVRYLGPLRDPPRPVYPLEALPSNTDVGYRGEHTAAVLDMNGWRNVEYFCPPTDDLTDDYISSAKLKTSSLHDAVVEWLSYLGVAEGVETTDQGVFGNRLRVSTSTGAKLHDLTNVGVGVSQVLPIVVSALLGEEPCLLIYEQPELHLHPKVQARLADLFLSLALSRKQVLAETHSEYLIDRLRLRVALSKDDRVRKLLSVLFSQRSSGVSELKQIKLTEFGSVVEWPVDFFDQSQGDVARILKAAALKRKLAATRGV